MRELIRKILNEEVPSQVRRRQGEFDRIFLHYRDSFIGHEYRNFNIYWNILMETSMETLYHALFSKTIKDDDWEESAEYIENYLIKKYKDEAKQMWEKKHHKRLNESKEKTNYLPIIENIVEPFKEDECICDINMWYDDEDDMYSVYLVFGTEELNGKFTSDGKFTYVRKKQKEVEETIKGYLPIKNIRVGSYGTPHCEWSPLNESEEKKSSLLTIIEENGLYNLVSSTGLHINEIEQKVGQLSREVLERFIIDVVKEHHNAIDDDGKTYIIYLEDYPFDAVSIGDNDYVDQLRVSDNELFFFVTLYEEDEYGDLEEQSYEIVSPKNLLYFNIYEIAGQLGFLLGKGQI